MIIRWLPLKDYEQFYLVSTGGQVQSLRRNRLLSPNPNTSGRMSVVLSSGKSSFVTRQVHRLVAQTFLPNPNNYPCINHIDGDYTNNLLSNLEWCTPLQNSHHAWKNGLMNRRDGEYNGRAKLKKKDIPKIKKLLKKGYCQKTIGTMFGVSQTSISKVKVGATWS